MQYEVNSNGKEVAGVWLKRIVAMMTILVIAVIAKYFFGDICGFAAAIFAYAILRDWMEC